ncbi:MAG: VWA domain-containing protein [Treponema sp.]|nr:VWA domain-containing protein [Treponema sp.]
MRRLAAVFFSLISALFTAYAQDLVIHPEDLRLVYDAAHGFDDAAGYHLYIRKKAGMESVMLVETTKDPEGTSDSFAYRAKEYNPVNGDEVRYLDGKVLVSDYARFSLIDSTAEADSQFGEAFHIYIPAELVYGYPWERNGVVKIGRGTFINIRAFEKPYGDYAGAYADNPYMFDLGAPVKRAVPEETQPPKEAEPAPIEEPVILTDDYNPVAVDSFKEIAGFGGGKMVYSRGPDSIVDDAMDAINRIDKNQIVDVVFAIDTTGSMIDDIQKLREDWIPLLTESLAEYADIRIGLLLYRDYGDTYRYMNLPVKFYDFTRDIKLFTRHLNDFVIHGKEGGDIPEAVYEALYGSMEFYKWRPEAYRKIILIGDAEPHPKPRGSGKFSKELVAETANKKAIVIDTIIVPDDKSRRGR